MVFSFGARKKQLKLAAFLQRVVDVTTSTLPESHDLRTERRYERFLPVLCVPWVNDEPDVERAVLAHTRDISNRGFGLLMNDSWEGDELVVGFWLEGAPHFVRGTVRIRRPMGGVFTQLGIELSELLDPQEFPQVQCLIQVVEGLAPGDPASRP